jgi:ribosomal protein S18 acetylase RimI-like enzyme
MNMENAKAVQQTETQSNTPIDIQALSRSSADVARFLEVSYPVYRNDPNWVAPLLMDLKKVFTDKNPLFEHAQMQLWVAVQDGRDIGRIAGILDASFNERNGSEPAAFFGFFECANHAGACERLIGAVMDWARTKGAHRLLGPMNPTTNDECGLLIEGFDSPPVFMMTYNPPYYTSLLDTAGFGKAKDLLAYLIDLSVIPMDRLKKIAAKVRQRNPSISFRPVLKKTLASDIGKIKEIYNAAWQDNWGFVPMTDREVDFMAERLKPLLMEGLIWLAEAAGGVGGTREPVGFLLAMPDYNIPLQPLRGRLLTPKVFGFLPYALGWKKLPRTRVLTLGVKENYRSRGLETAMLIEGLKTGFEAGVRESEASWILEDNVMMCRMLEAIGGRVYKRYRIYEKSI